MQGAETRPAAGLLGGDSVGDEQCKGRVNQPLQDGVTDPGLERSAVPSA